MRILPRDCERARQWTSAELDAELSDFEAVLLRAHLGCCESCSAFHRQIHGLTHVVREAPLERLERTIEIRRVRRSRLRLAPVAAAMAAVSVGLGSLMASSQFHSDSVGASAAPPTRSFSFDPDTRNAKSRQLLRTQTGQSVVQFGALLPTGSESSLHGGPVVEDR